MQTNAFSRYIYWDSCVFIDYFEYTNDRIDVISDTLKEIKEGAGSKIYTSIITVAEVNCLAAEKNQKIPRVDFVSQLDAMWNDRSVIAIVELDRTIARLARDISRQGIQQGWVLKPFDAIHLATAYWVKRNIRPSLSEIHTYDTKLGKYSTFIDIDICPPNATQPSLGVPGI